MGDWGKLAKSGEIRKVRGRDNLIVDVVRKIIKRFEHGRIRKIENLFSRLIIVRRMVIAFTD